MSTYRLRTKGGYSLSSPVVIMLRNEPPNCGLNLDVLYSTTHGVLVGEVSSMADVVTPKFHKLQKEGNLVFSPMSMETRTSAVDVEGNGYTRQQWPTPTCSVSGKSFWSEVSHNGPYFAVGVCGNVTDQLLPQPVALPVVTDGEQRLITEICTSVLADRGAGSTNLFESVAEYKQTLALFGTPFKGLFRFFRKNGKAMKLVGPAKAWLAYRYGILPFIHDVNAIISGLEKKVGLKRETTRKSGEIHSTSFSTSSFSSNVARTDFSLITTDSLTVRAMAIDEYMATVASNIGFSGKNLITVPWELLPFSFVLDWFISVGDFLKAYAPSPGYKMIGSCLTVDRLISNLWTPINTVPTVGGIRIIRQVSGACTSTYRLKTRGVLQSAGIVVRSNFKFDSLIRCADTLALLSVIASSYFSEGKGLAKAGSLLTRK